MMQATNFCRQMVKQFSAALEIPTFPPTHRAVLSHAIDLAHASQKFLLPDGGRLYDDPEYRALDDSEPLNLPFPFIALEYTRSQAWAEARSGRAAPPAEVRAQPRKMILFARQQETGIVIMPILFSESDGTWGPMPECSIPRVGFLDRSAPRENGYVMMRAQLSPMARQLGLPPSDYAEDCGTLACFLNILRCSNVRSDLVRPKRDVPKRKGNALPFDTYHVLTLDTPRIAGGATTAGTHRSPREHLRRGHIRRLDDGRRIWVNATVVNAGVGGKVAKDYRIR